MIAIISSIVVVITVLISVLVSFTPNVRAVLQTDFMRNATNNTYIYGWEKAQMMRRAGKLATVATGAANPANSRRSVGTVTVGGTGNPVVPKEQLTVTARYHRDNLLADTHLDICCSPTPADCPS